MPADWNDGDELPPEEAKQQTADMLADPKHVRPEGHPDDLATVDDAITDDDEE